MQNILRKGIGVLMLSFFLSSCSELDEVFVNPNQSTGLASIKNYSASAFYYTFAGPRFLTWNTGALIYANTWAHQFTHGGVGSWFGSTNGYDGRDAGWMETAFKKFSTASGQDRVLWWQAVDRKDEASEAIAKTLFLYNLSFWTKVFGNVPFDDIYTYDLNKVSTQPRYESQDSVFIKILKELGSISEKLSGLSGTASVENGDFLYKGDVKKWEKFVNTLRLRLALDARDALNKISYNVDDVIKECISKPLIASHDDEAIFTRGTNPELTSDIDGGIEDVYYSFPTQSNFAPMQDFIDYLQDTTDIAKSDPRLSIWCIKPTFLHKILIDTIIDTTTNPGTRDTLQNGFVEIDTVSKTIKNYPNSKSLYQGVSFAISYSPLLVTGENVSKFTTAILGESTTKAPKIRIMTLAESKLLQAEAASRGIVGSVGNLYSEALTADMEYWGVPAADITNYLSNGKNSKTAPTTTDIMRELWVTSFTNNWQAWTLLKRTKHTELAQAIGIKAPKQYRSNGTYVLPSRYPYPDSEKQLNPNAKREGDAIGGDAVYSYMKIDTRAVDNTQVGKF